MSDTTPAHGIARPGPLALLEHDEYTAIAVELRTLIRAAFATAVAKARTWEPGRRSTASTPARPSNGAPS